MFVFHFSLFFSKMKWRAHIIIRGVNIFMLFYCFFVWSCVSLFFLIKQHCLYVSLHFRIMYFTSFLIG